MSDGICCVRPSARPAQVCFAGADWDTALRNIQIYKCLNRALLALSNAGIQVIVLKGAALAETVYPSVAERPMCDVDLLVHAQDRDPARSALEKAGYSVLPEPKRLFSPFDNEFTGEMSFVRNNEAPVELHWELTVIEWLRRLSAIDMSALWAEAQPIHLISGAALQLSPRDTLLQVCLHLATHGYAHRVAYQDIRHLIEHYEPFPWAAFLERARGFKLRVVCYFALESAARLTGAAVPRGVLANLRPSTPHRWLVRLMLEAKGKRPTGEPTQAQNAYLLQLALADRPMDLLGVAVWLFFPGPRWLAERYRLASSARAWLACLWHPLVVLGQGIGGLKPLFTRLHVWRYGHRPAGQGNHREMQRSVETRETTNAVNRTTTSEESWN